MWQQTHLLFASGSYVKLCLCCTRTRSMVRWTTEQYQISVRDKRQEIAIRLSLTSEFTWPTLYYWRDLPQNCVATNTYLTRQKEIVTNIFCHCKQFYCDKILERFFIAWDFCRCKHTFVATKDVFCVCRDKIILWQPPPVIALTLSVAASNCSIGRTTLQTFLCVIMKMLVYII